MNKEEEMREKAIQFELLKQQVEAIEKQIAELEAKTSELTMVQHSINEIKGQRGKEILVPMGSGVFMKGNLASDSEMLVELGANVVAGKSAKETVAIIQKQLKEIDRVKDQMREDLFKFIAQMEQLEPEIVKYYSEKK